MATTKLFFPSFTFQYKQDYPDKTNFLEEENEKLEEVFRVKFSFPLTEG